MALLPPEVNENFPADPGQLTPLFKQYVEIKAEYPEALLMYRLGDFYEMFGPDAVVAAELLGLTLTARACMQGYKVAMCGIPHHASARYIKRLVEAGQVAAICEQVSDPAESKGLVERAVTRVITAGTLVEDEYLTADSSNFLAVLAERGGQYAVALLESSGGSVELMELPTGATLKQAREAADRHSPQELLVPELSSEPELALAARLSGPSIHAYQRLPSQSEITYFLERFFNTNSLDAFGLGKRPAAQAALFALVRYLKETFKVGNVRLYPRLVPLAGKLLLDERTIKHLELLDTEGGTGVHSLYGLLNACQCAAGRRELKRWLVSPSADLNTISQRHAVLGVLLANKTFTNQVLGLLAQIQDLERIINRIGLRKTHPKELRALVDSLLPLAELSVLLHGAEEPYLRWLGEQIVKMDRLHERLDAVLAADPPVKPVDGGVIRPGADQRCDELRELCSGGSQWFRKYEEMQRERTGIKSLKVKSTGAFGYFIEIGKANLALVPDDYHRRQTLVNHERFTTEELSRREADTKNAEGKYLAREAELFAELLGLVDAQAERLHHAARAVAALDVLVALASVAARLKWVRPELLEDGARLELTKARHPLVEQAVGERYYAANDCCFDQAGQQVMLLTGPNMGGKSTYLRMIAVLAVLNQIGSYLPAESAALPVFKRIYTRVGAQDSLQRGQSTFMVEMLETAEILNTCVPGSLVLLDEIGRGTSTYDGISIAKAVLEYLHQHPAQPFVLFATHFFELTDLPLMLPRVKNFQVEVAQQAGKFVFLYRVSPGAASDSYGIEVASLAGLPASLVQRAREVLAELEGVKAEARERARQIVQLGLFIPPATEPPK